MNSRRPVAIALAASAFYAGIFVTTAHAEMHYVRVTLVTGQQITITVDIPPGTPVSQLQIPGLPAATASIFDLAPTAPPPAPPAAPTVAATVAPTATPTATAQPTATSTPNSKTGKTKTGKTDKTKKAKPKTDTAVNEAKGTANTESLTGKVAPPTPTPTPMPDDQSTPPSKDNPTLSIAEPGAAKPGVPNFFIDK